MMPISFALLALTALQASAETRQTLLSAYTPSGKEIPVAFFDADSTLRVAPSGQPMATTVDDVLILPCVGPRLKQLADDGYFVAIVSNQDRTKTPIEIADGALATTVRKIVSEQGGVVHYFDFAEDHDEYRKAGVGMATRRLAPRLAQWFNGATIDMKRSFMVGDAAYQAGDQNAEGRSGTHFANTDRLFAEHLFVQDLPFRPWAQHFFEPAVFFGWRQEAGVDVFKTAGQVKEFQTNHPKACCRVIRCD